MQLPCNMKQIMSLKALTNERVYKIFLYSLAPTLFQVSSAVRLAREGIFPKYSEHLFLSFKIWQGSQLTKPYFYVLLRMVQCLHTYLLTA